MLRQDSGWRTATPRHALSVMGVHWFDGLRWMLRDEATEVRAQQRSSAAIDCAGETDVAVIVDLRRRRHRDRGRELLQPGPAHRHGRHRRCRAPLLLTYAGLTVFDGAGSQTGQRATPFPGDRKPGATLRNLELLHDAIRTGTEPVNGGQDNLQTIALLDAAYRAAETGEVAIPRTLVPA